MDQCDAIYSNRCNGQCGVIIRYENHKERDTNSKAERLFCSEVVWQSFLLACKADGAKPSGLRLLIQHFVINKETKIAISEVIRSSNVTSVGEDDRRVYTERDKGFYVLLGSVLGAQMMRILLDHRSDLGHRIVEHIVILPIEKDQEKSTATRSLMFVLSEPRRTE